MSRNESTERSADERPGLVVIGASWGGVEAIRSILGHLDETFPLPVAMVQHRHKSSETILCQMLGAACALPVIEPDDKERIVRGTVYLAPANYHLLVERDHLCLSVDDLVHYSRPSVDVLFETAADTFGDRCIGILLTGANRDGAAGLRRIEDRGGRIIVQDPSTAESPTMPEAGLEETRHPNVVPLDQIGPYLASLGRDFQP